ncbi:hypothetical protein DL96DRAFT_1821486 [Flagelloscypha sp. PMI_526]|nr:hypothetical protein DL96DRAFT_1821486 [Flagelloscypha sp. PMI_526]
MSSEIHQRHLPEELLFHIFELFLDSPQSSTSIHLLLVSKRVYYWLVLSIPSFTLSHFTLDFSRALPHFYRDLKFLPEDARRPHGGVQRSRLIENAQPTSLLLVRNLQCGTVHGPHSFSPFPNLKRLALWGRHLFNVRQTYSLLDLSLEELVIWNFSDIGVLKGTIRCCQWISGRALHKSLRKISGRVCAEQEILDAFPYLTHVLVGSALETLDDKKTTITSTLLLRESIRCYILFSWKITHTNPRVHPNGIKRAEELRDRRIVHVRVRPTHLYLRGVDSDLDFWGEQAEMWKRAEKAVAENTSPKIVTVLEAI